MSQDRTWKTTDVIPPSFSLATATSSWPEQCVSHVSHVTGNRSTMFCIVCSYEFSIHTQLLLLRAYSKSCSIYTTKPTLRWSTSIKSDSGPAKKTVFPELSSKSDSGPAEEKDCIVQRMPSPLLLVEEQCVKLPLRRTKLLLCKRLSRAVATKTQNAELIVRYSFVCIYFQ